MDYPEEWMKDVTPKDMPNDDLRYIADVAGLDSAMAMIILTPGVNVPVPMNALMLVKQRYIRNNYDGTKYSINKLAVACRMSTRNVYRILSKRNSNQKSPPQS